MLTIRLRATVTGLRDIPRQDRPPVLAVFVAFRIMTGLGVLMLLLLIVAWLRRNSIASSRVLLRAFLYLIPLPYILCGLGWTVAEMGRQPWIVYGLMRTQAAVSPVAGLAGGRLARGLHGCLHNHRHNRLPADRAHRGQRASRCRCAV